MKGFFNVFLRVFYFGMKIVIIEIRKKKELFEKCKCYLKIDVVFILMLFLYSMFDYEEI